MDIRNDDSRRSLVKLVIIIILSFTPVIPIGVNYLYLKKYGRGIIFLTLSLLAFVGSLGAAMFNIFGLSGFLFNSWSFLGGFYSVTWFIRMITFFDCIGIWRRPVRKSETIKKHTIPIKTVHFEETKKQNEKEEENEQEHEGKKLAKDLERIYHSFVGTNIETAVLELVKTTNKIFDFVDRYPKKMRNLDKFISYYLPTTLKLLDSYHHLQSQGKKGKNISEASQKIEELLGNLQKAFDNQLDCLFEDKAMDIDAEISTLSTILENEGLLKKESL